MLVYILDCLECKNPVHSTNGGFRGEQSTETILLLDKSIRFGKHHTIIIKRLMKFNHNDFNVTLCYYAMLVHFKLGMIPEKGLYNLIGT